MHFFHRTILCSILIAVLATPAFAAPKPPQVEVFNCDNYALTPPFLADAVAPSTTLIVDSSGSMNEHAYQETEVRLWTPSSYKRAYTGYNSSLAYYGFFDSKSFYSYNSTGGYFYSDASGSWSGNFLNWTSMHRTDVVRKVLTGGPYDTTSGTYKVSRTDEGSENRGMYHVYNANTQEIENGNSAYSTPYKQNIALTQSKDNDYLTVYSISSVDTSVSPNRWVRGSELGKFILKVKSDKQYGMLDRFGYRMRLALFRYDDDDTMNNGGYLVNHMTSDPTQISTIIDNIDELKMDSWTPLAETLYTVCGYIQQDGTTKTSGPKYENDSYSTGIATTKDPFYFSDLKKNVHCTQQNVILITDGESTKDQNIPTFLKDSAYDKAGNDGLAYSDDGSGYLENVAYWAHTTDLRSSGAAALQGNQTVNLYTVFAFGSGSQLLQEAAKWGGFIDKNNNNLPETSEYDANGDGVPDNYFEASSGSELENALIVAFSSILNRVSSGSAASVVSTSRKGEGLLYQAVFWPERVDSNGNQTSWTGDVYAYWLDDEGIMHEDNGGASPQKLADDDNKITIWYDQNVTPKRSRACSGGTVVNGTCVGGITKELTAVKHVWSASKWLNQSGLNPTDQRSSYNSTSTGDLVRRYITTWKDDGDGKIESGEIVPFNDANINLSYCNSTVVNWIRGQEQTGMRSRATFIDTNYDGFDDTNVIWRLGDIINSSPTVVAGPAENYDLYWNDTTYGEFYRKYKNRRIMVYFGGNDGMLHAVNSGFYSPEDRAYFKHMDTDGTYSNAQGFDLGTEMWAYVPYNLLPNLPCLTSTKYQHQYYVDLKPRVFDAQVFAKDGDHPNGWGTLMVCGFNFGGDGQQDLVKDSRYFGSSFFIFDITNPEKEPVLLGEFTFDGNYTLGYTVNQPTLVVVKDNSNVKHWYMLFATGPLTAAGTSTQKAQVIVVPIKEMIDTNNNPKSTFPLRLADDKSKPTTSSMGVLSLSDSNSAMGTGFVSVDYNFDFFVDMMYYGTVVTPNSGVLTGGIHRLKVESEPDPSKWERKEMTDTGGPMTGAPNIGFKNNDIWVYFGTGKFWDVSDKTDLRTQWMYGIQEPKFTNSNAYNFSTIPAGNLIDVTKMLVKNDGLGTLVCSDGSSCLPSGVTTVEELAQYIKNSNSIDGWKRAMINSGERVIGQPTLFGGLTNFTTFTPSSDYCTAEGSSKLYALYYLTGTAWKEDVFGDSTGEYVPFVVDLGQGMGVSPSLHLGSEEGVRAFVQTSTGTIIEIHQPNLPIPNVKSGRGGWHTIETD